MKARFVSFVCRVLTASLIVLPWQSQAGMIATDQALAAAQAKVAAFVARDEVATRLQQLGISPQAAKERVAALSAAEVADLAGRIDALPAGGSSVLPLLVVIWLLLYFFWFEPSKAKAAAKAPAKPAPEKK